MALESTSENAIIEEEKTPQSPGRSKLKLSSAFGRLNPAKMFSRKKSGTDISAPHEANIEGSVQAVEQVAEKIVESITHQTPPEHRNEDGKSSTVEPHKQHSWGEKLAEKVEKTKDTFKHEVKEGIEKVESTIDTTLKDIMTFVHKDHHKANEDNPTNEPPQEEDTSKMPQQVKDEQVDDTSEPSPLKQNEGTSNESEEEPKLEEKKNEKEDYCATSLAQGLQKICAPWSSNKED